MKSILLHVHSDGEFDNRLAIAIDLCTAFGAHLTCLQTASTPVYAGIDPMLGAVLEEAIAGELEASEAAVREKVEAQLKRAGVSWSWEPSRGDVAQAVVDGALLHDLVIISQRATGLGGAMPPLPIVDEVVVSSACAVLVVAEGCSRIDWRGAVAVAWNATAEAAAAIRQARPLLQLAAMVHLVSVGEDDAETPQTAANVYLSRHGIRSELHCLPQTGLSTGESLGEFALKIGAAYLVMGAYGHSRLRELLLGGATRRLLTKSRVPLVMAH